ncbi:MAG TPA: hypothetical protein VH951_10300 [Dehalococcoidia bacterium]|jgi:hypothetical protein
MPKKRRQAHIPQTVTRKRRPSRRPEFEGTPAEQPEFDTTEPSFADAPVANIPGYATGVVATRAGGRRLEQLRRSSAGEHAAPRVVTGQLPTFERAYLVNELRRIFITSGILLALIVVLAFVLR